MKKTIFIIIIGLLLAFPVLAHQPRIVEDVITDISNPDVSQAFYGNLSGEPALFRINLEESAKIYFGILVPDIENIDKDLIVTISSDNGFYYVLDGTKHNWEYFYEEFAGDHYYDGPDIELDLEKGVYDVQVSSSDNQGKYVLVIGKKEEFPIGEIINTLIVLPQLKKDFFEKSAFTAYFNLVGLFIFGPIILIIVLILLRKKIKELIIWKCKLAKDIFNFLFRRNK